MGRSCSLLTCVVIVVLAVKEDSFTSCLIFVIYFFSDAFKGPGQYPKIFKYLFSIFTMRYRVSWGYFPPSFPYIFLRLNFRIFGLLKSLKIDIKFPNLVLHQLFLTLSPPLSFLIYKMWVTAQPLAVYSMTFSNPSHFHYDFEFSFIFLSIFIFSP